LFPKSRSRCHPKIRIMFFSDNGSYYSWI
jgi:hypothetical protein